MTDVFVGRARELSALDRLFGQGARLVTLTGVGGVGKTRMALEWARGAEGSWRRAGASYFFCELSEARSVDAMCAVLARALGVALAAQATADEAVVQIGEALSALDRAVLVLDNLEQMAALAAPMIETWLALAPGVQVLATSRERLRLREEQCVAVEPLGMPAEGAVGQTAIAASEAVELFVARTRQARFDFELGEADAPVVAEIVRRLEGIPLAIELCAARMGVLGPRQIVQRLSRPLDLLVSGAQGPLPHGAPARHGTLRAAIAWSWDLLERRERQALSQCSVFRGGFSLEAAEAVVVFDEGDAAPVLDVLQSLHDKSLLRTFEPPDFPGERRYALLESVRELCAERLAAEGDKAAAMERHSVFHAGRSGTPLPPRAPIRRLALEADNLSAVCARALAREPRSPASADVALRALLLLEPLYLGSASGRLEPYSESLDAALSAASPPLDPVIAARALYTRALADFLRGRLLDCLLGFRRSVDVARAAGARLCEAMALSKLGLMLQHADRRDEARACFEEASAIAEALGDPGLDGDLALTRGGLLTWLGQADEAAAQQARAIEGFRLAGDARGESMAAGQLALARLNQGRYDEGEAAATLALSLLEAQEEQRIDGYVLGILGRLHQARGRFDEARATLLAAVDIHRAVGDRWSEGVHRGFLGNLAFDLGHHDDAVTEYTESVALLRGTGERHYVAIFLAALGAAEVALGREAAAREHVSAAAGALRDVQVLATQLIVALFSAHLTLAEAREAALRGDAPGADRRVRAASEPIDRAESASPDGSPPIARSSEEVRYAVRMLRRALSAFQAAHPGGGQLLAARGGAGEPAAVAAADPALIVGPDARWFRARGHEPVSLLRARAARLMLLRLVGHRLAAPGAALPLEALFEAGWPGERIQRRAAANRVYVTLTKLKNMGLRPLIQSRDDGFLLDPSAIVHEAPSPVADPAPSRPPEVLPRGAVG